MISAYAFRLVCLSFAVFFLLHSAAAMLIAARAASIIRRAEQWRASAAARAMLILRLLPAAGALFVVCAICVPSYLRLEPKVEQEEMGAACLAMAALGAALWIGSIARTVRAAVRSTRQVRKWRETGVQTTLDGSSVWVVEDAGRTLALAGVFRPVLAVSNEIVEALPPDQLAAALRHERAHWTARDNFQRLLMFLSPDAGLLRGIERAWCRFCEWSADDRAADGDWNRPVLLAAALVKVARVRPAPVPPLATALVANTADLETRISRLLGNPCDRRVPSMFIAALLAAAAGMIALALHPATFAIAYAVLERLVD